MKKQIIIAEKDWEDSIYKTIEWEQSVIIEKWEHDFEEKKYTIDYKEKEK